MGPHWELVSDAINSTLQFKVMNIALNFIDTCLCILDAFQVIVNDCIHYISISAKKINYGFLFPPIFSGKFSGSQILVSEASLARSISLSF